VNQSATAEELKRAYRKMARKYHPDVRREALFGQGGVCRRRVTNWRGNDPVQGGQVVAAGDARLHAQALTLLAAGAV